MSLLRSIIAEQSFSDVAGSRPTKEMVAKSLDNVPEMLTAKYLAVRPLSITEIDTTQDNHLVPNDGMVKAYREGTDIDPITVSRTGKLLDGHHRVASAKEAGFKRIWSVVVEVNVAEMLEDYSVHAVLKNRLDEADNDDSEDDVPHFEHCPTCNGSGKLMREAKCPWCRGAGFYNVDGHQIPCGKCKGIKPEKRPTPPATMPSSAELKGKK